MIALALSGGGSRAIAFHLGCMRALHDRGILQKVSAISAVSGGSVIAAMYAYSNDDFTEFELRVTDLLKRGLHEGIIRNLLCPELLLKIIATNIVSRPAAFAATFARHEPPFRRWASRTDGLERALREEFGNISISKIARNNLDVVFNACEMRTGTAFRFGNQKSGAWRFGELAENNVSVAHAVACSAAYPMFLPAFDRRYTFIKKGKAENRRVIISDGGVYDNLGIGCLEPGRDTEYTLHAFPADYIICCYAGHGQFSGERLPYGFLSRTNAAFESIFRKVQDAALQRLHAHQESGKIKGFILPYLGQQDSSLPSKFPDFVKREEVFGYPTNFAAMREVDIGRIALRGEQLTRLLIAQYIPEV